MTITLKTTGNTDVVLCHGADQYGTKGKHIPIGSRRTEAEWSIRPKRPIGAADETPLDGGHAVWPYAFSIWIEFATEALADQFVDEWPASLPRTGATLVIDYTSKQYTRSNAVLKKITIQQYTVAVQIDYIWQTTRPVDTTPAP